MPTVAETAATLAAITSRRSVRAFRPDPVPDAIIDQILSASARAPSGTNMQPWHVHVLTGAALKRMADTIQARFLAGESDKAEYAYYPPTFREPYLSRRRKVGFDMYGLIGIGKGDTERMKTQHGQNFRFFDAPVGMIFTMDADLEIGSILDYGMFLQSIMIAARAFGLDTCPQAAFITQHKAIRELLGLGENQRIICGMALGYADETAPINQLVTERAPLAEFVARHAK
jgi:nitroreductase